MTAGEHFWRWFQDNQPFLYHYEKDREHIFPALEEELRKIHPELTFEFGPKNGDQREFVISANGQREAFSSVLELVAAAPELPRWKIVPFRQRRRAAIAVGYGETQFSPSQVEFTYEVNQGQLDLVLFLNDYDALGKPGDYQTIAWILLEHLLGEYDLEMKVRSIAIEDFRHFGTGPRRKLSELPSVVDAINTVQH